MGNESPTLVETPTTAPSGSIASVALPSPESVLHTAEIGQSRRMAMMGLIFNVLAVAIWPQGGKLRRWRP